MTRIIAGTAGGRRLAVPLGPTRPTSDRAREALFSTLGPLDGCHVLDLYAGSGAVGLEALSRGAAAALLVDAHTAGVIRRNLAATGLPGATVLADDVTRALRRTPDRRYDVVFADPPYAVPDDELGQVLELLVPWLAAAATVVVERSKRSAAPPWPAGIAPVQHRRYGEATLWYGRAS